MSLKQREDASSFVVASIGPRRVALFSDGVSELIGSPLIHSFPHTTPLIRGVVVRRGQILPVLDLGPGVFGEPSPPTRFFLVLERDVGGQVDRCAIPVQGECELVSGVFIPCEEDEGCVIGFLEASGERIEVLGLERTILAGSGEQERAGAPS